MFHLQRKMKPGVPWILHGYTGNEMVTKQLLQQDFYFSFGSALMDEKSPARKSIGLIPKERLFFETDEEGLSVTSVYEMASEILEVKKEKLGEQIEWNFRQVFVRG